MLRIRSTRLLSGASAIAILTALAAGGSAQAVTVFTGPFITPPVSNTTENDSVAFTTFATVDRNAGTNASNTALDTAFDSFFNGKTMSSLGANLIVSNSYLTGDVEIGFNMTSTASDSVDVTFSQIGGRFFNAATITGNANGINLENNSTITGGIVNIGSVIGTVGDGIHVDTASEIFQGIRNTNLIQGGNDGIGVNNANVDVFGGINNSGTVTALGTTAGAAINWGGHSFTGGILNTGTIQGLVQSDGIRVTAGTVAGDLDNQGTVTGTGAGRAAFFMSGGTFSNDIENSGVMQGLSGAIGIQLTGGTFSGAINNNTGGTIQGPGNAILMTGGTLAGGIHNFGLISSPAGTAIEITGGTFQGGISNSSTGSILASSTAILVSGGTFAGGITNQGFIQTFLFSGDGIHLGAVTFTDSILNTGTIDAAQDGIELNGTTFSTNITNSGSLNARNGTGIWITGASTVSGSVTNSGHLTAGVDGIRLDAGSTIAGNVLNDTGGHIEAVGVGVLLAGTVNGSFTNNGIIDPAFGVQVTGTVTGGIFNTDSIIGTTAGIDLATEVGTTIVTQTAGLLRGNSIEDGSGVIGDALRMNNAHANTFYADGGVLDGNVVANITDNIQMDPDAVSRFIWLRGTGTTIGAFNANGANGSQAVLGAGYRGDASGVGVLVGAQSAAWSQTRVYLDDDTRVNLVNGYFGGEGAVAEFYLTSTVANHAIIAAGGAIDTQRENIEAFVDGTTFGSIGGDTFNYLGVMTGASTNGTDGAINTNSLFFEGKAIFNPTTVDIRLTRLSFFDALVLPGLTQNEASVGAALDNIYGLGPLPGGYGPDFAQLFNYLLSLGVGDEAAALFVYNELSGEEHAQLQQTTLDILNPFNTFMGQRLDEAKASMGGVGFANNTLHQYAQASAVMTDTSPGVARGSSGVSLWARGYDQSLNADGDPEAPGYEQNTGGAAGGVDFAIGSNAIAGVALGWSNTDVDFDTPGDKASVDSFQVGAYGSYGFGRFYIDAEAAGAFHDLSTTRLLNLPSPPGGMIAGANYDARAFSASGEFGAVWTAGRVLIQPNAGLMFTDVSTDAFIESGAGDFNLIVNESDATSLASSVGLRAATQFKAGGMTIMPELSGAWRHEFDDDRTTFSAAFPDDPTSTFNIISSKISADSALVGAGVTAGLSQNFEIFLNYNGLLNQDVDVHNGSAGLRATW